VPDHPTPTLPKRPKRVKFRTGGGLISEAAQHTGLLFEEAENAVQYHLRRYTLREVPTVGPVPRNTQSSTVRPSPIQPAYVRTSHTNALLSYAAFHTHEHTSAGRNVVGPGGFTIGGAVAAENSPRGSAVIHDFEGSRFRGPCACATTPGFYLPRTSQMRVQYAEVGVIIPEGCWKIVICMMRCDKVVYGDVSYSGRLVRLQTGKWYMWYAVYHTYGNECVGDAFDVSKSKCKDPEHLTDLVLHMLLAKFLLLKIYVHESKVQVRNQRYALVISCALLKQRRRMFRQERTRWFRR
jgi:hypothetical protein